jgi:hypothetical protein
MEVCVRIFFFFFCICFLVTSSSVLWAEDGISNKFPLLAPSEKAHNESNMFQQFGGWVKEAGQEVTRRKYEAIEKEKANNPEAFTMEDLPWHKIEVDVPEGCVNKRLHFFKNIDVIEVKLQRNAHNPFKRDDTKKKVYQSFLNKGIDITSLVEPLLVKHFSDSCIPIKKYNGSFTYFEVPMSTVILDIQVDFIASDLIGDENAIYSVVFSSSFKRPIQIETRKGYRGRPPQKSVTHNIRMYPRILRITSNMDHDEIMKSIENELVIQLDYYIARMVLGKMIWNTHIESDSAYDFYGTADEAYWPFQ